MSFSIANPNARLEAFCGSAVTTDVKYTVGYFNMPQQTTSNQQAQLASTIRTLSNGTSDVQIAPYPGQNSTTPTSGTGAAQVIEYVKAHNTNASEVTVTIQITDTTATTDDIQFKCVVPAGGSAYYESGRGWYVLDADGALVTSLGIFPSKPMFLAYNSADDTNQTGNGATATVDFDTEVFDVQGNFASDTFTAPVTGKYLLTTGVQISALPAGCTQGFLTIVTSNRNYRTIDAYVAATFTIKSFGMSVVADMDAADTATVAIQFSGGAGNTATIDGASELVTFFSGAQVG